MLSQINRISFKMCSYFIKSINFFWRSKWAQFGYLEQRNKTKYKNYFMSFVYTDLKNEQGKERMRWKDSHWPVWAWIEQTEDGWRRAWARCSPWGHSQQNNEQTDNMILHILMGNETYHKQMKFEITQYIKCWWMLWQKWKSRNSKKCCSKEASHTPF